MKKKFLFVVPKFADNGHFYFFPTGIGYVVSSMKKAGFNVLCLNLCHSDEPIEKQLVENIEKYNIDAVWTGAMATDWGLVNNIVTIVKSYSSEIITVVGGAIISSEPEISMLGMPIDFGVIGEGEITSVELAEELCLNNMYPEKVNGLILYSSAGQLTTTPERSPVMDLDDIPFPDYEALEFDKFLKIKWDTLPSIKGIYFDVGENQKIAEILTSRSCPYSCTFCYHPLGKKYRQRSLDNVFEEIDYLVNNYNIRILNILDELFSLDKDRIKEFCRRIKKHDLIWMGQWRVDNVDLEVLKECKASGLQFLGLGVESMSDKVLRSMKKHISTEDVNNAYNIIKEAGIHGTSSNLIFGDINETESTLNESLKWFFKHPELNINLAMIRAIPDSEVWRYVIAKGLVLDKKEYFVNKMPNINFSRLSQSDYVKCGKIVQKSDKMIFTMKAEELRSDFLNENFQGKKLYKFSIKCPHCQSVSTYKHYLFIRSKLSPVVCKSCQKLLSIRTRIIFYKDFNLVDEFISEKVIDTLRGKLRNIYRAHLKKIVFFNKLCDLVKKILKME